MMTEWRATQNILMKHGLMANSNCMCGIIVLMFGQVCTSMYKYVQVCTSMYKYVQVCISMYKYVQVCTSMYMYVQVTTVHLKELV